jgi:hypothetical protein
MEKSEYELSQDEVQTIADLQQAQKDLQQQLQGVLRLIARQQKLEGEWRMEDNKLTKVVS